MSREARSRASASRASAAAHRGPTAATSPEISPTLPNLHFRAGKAREAPSLSDIDCYLEKNVGKMPLRNCDVEKNVGKMPLRNCYLEKNVGKMPLRN